MLFLYLWHNAYMEHFNNNYLECQLRIYFFDTNNSLGTTNTTHCVNDIIKITLKIIKKICVPFPTSFSQVMIYLLQLI